jgi:hypothetical protein
LAVEAQQPDSTVSNNTNLPAPSQSAAGTVPRLIKFAGVVKDLSPTVPTEVVGLTFSLYELPEGGSPLWVETQSLPLDSLGRYTALLGANSPGGLPLDLFTTGKALWVGVQAQLPGQGEQPRVLLAPVPYSLKCSDSDTLGGLPASAYALAGSQTLEVPAGGAALSSASSTTAQAANETGVVARSDSSLLSQAACIMGSDGKAAANTVAKFTSACTAENSLIRDNGTGVAVGGTSAPAALFDVQYTSTATSGGSLGQRVLNTINPAATSSAYTVGAFSDALTAAGNTQNFTAPLAATASELSHYGTGAVAAAYGTGISVLNQGAGTITQAFGVYANLWNTSTGTITNGYGMYVNAPLNSGGGTFSNYTGLYIASPSAVKGAYGLYSAGGTNYFGGNVGVGTTTPGANLEVNGTAKFDGLITFASGQSFPGTGTITGITTASGSGLTGGGTSGNLSLNVDESVVAFKSDLATGISTAESYANNTFLPLTGGTLRGALSGTAATFNGVITLAGGASGPTGGQLNLNSTGATNTGSTLADGSWWTGSVPYFRPLNSNQGGLALDLMPNGNPTAVWEDICSTDVVADAIANGGGPETFSCLNLRASPSANYVGSNVYAGGSYGTQVPLDLQPVGGWLGIGVVPSMPFQDHIATGINMAMDVNSNNHLRISVFNDAGSSDIPLDFQASEYHFLGNFGPEEMTINSSGDVGVAKLTAATSTGLCYDTTSIAGRYTLAACTSLRKFKADINPLLSALHELGRLKPVSYRSLTNGRNEVGFVAEDVNEVDARLSTFDKDGKLQGVMYDHMVALLTKAIQEQQAEIEVLKKQIADLEAGRVIR